MQFLVHYWHYSFFSNALSVVAPCCRLVRTSFPPLPQHLSFFGFICSYFCCCCLSVLLFCLTKPTADAGRQKGLSARQADLPSEQQSHYREEDGEDKEYIRGAHHRVVGQFVRLTPHLINVKSYWEDEGSHTEQDHCKRKRDTETGRKKRCIRNERTLAQLSTKNG